MYRSVPYKPRFHHAIRSAIGLNAAQGKRVCHCATEKGRGIDFPGRYPQVTVEQLEQQRELNKGLEMPLFWL